MHKQLQEIEQSLNNIFVEREKEIHGLTLAIMSNCNVLFLGPPGTGKSMLARMWAAHINDAKFFSWLLSRMTRDTEVVGAPDINTLVEKGKEIRNIEGKLPDCDIAFLDEIWKASSALNNHLLKILNERKFDNGEGDQDIPVLVIVAASNELPDEETDLQAAVDRFVVKFDVEPVREASNVLKMMDTHLKKNQNGIDAFDIPTISLKNIKKIREEVKAVKVPKDVRTTLYKIQNELYDAEVYPSARTINACLQIMQSEAYFHGRKSVKDDDLSVLVNCLWSDPVDKKIVFNKVMENISPEEPKILELYEDSKEIYENLMSTSNTNRMIEDGLEIVKKLQEAKKTMTKHLNSLKEKGKETREVERMVKEVSDFIEDTFINAVGIDPHAEED